MRRRALLKAAAGVGISFTGGAFLLARTGLTIANVPPVESGNPGDVPSEPSFVGMLAYLFILIYQSSHPINTIAQEIALTHDKIPLPSDISLETIDASGVPAYFVSAPGATKSRVILYIHGGGWAVPLQDQDRIDAANLSRQIGAYVFLPQYRLLPEHPFPAGLQDCVTAYRWLRSQGIAASQIVIMGGSAGAHLSLTTTIALRDGGDELPAAIVAMSPPTDMTMTGETYRTKAAFDPILGGGLARASFDAYTSNGAVDVRNPLVSPLYANLHGLPPMLLQVGTQEVLLSGVKSLATRLRAAGVDVILEVWPGMFHGWQGLQLPLPLPEGEIANQHIIQYIRRYLKA